MFALPPTMKGCCFGGAQAHACHFVSKNCRRRASDIAVEDAKVCLEVDGRRSAAQTILKILAIR